MTMRVKTEIGEIGIELNGCTYVLRPSFVNIEKIAPPNKIIPIMHVLLDNQPIPELSTLHRMYLHHKVKHMFETAVIVIDACGSLPRGVLGWYNCMRFVPGKISITNTIILAQSLLRSGVIGKPSLIKAKDKESTLVFNVRDFIVFATSQLGYSLVEAENLTMIEFQHAVSIALPVEDKSNDMLNDPDKYEAELERIQKLMDRELAHG